jgi:hypothetical protein
MVESESAMRVQPATAFPRKGVGSAETVVTVGSLDRLKNQNHTILETDCVESCRSIEVNVLELGNKEVVPPGSGTTEHTPDGRTGSRGVKFNPYWLLVA